MDGKSSTGQTSPEREVSLHLGALRSDMVRFGLIGSLSRIGGLLLLPILTRLLSIEEYGTIDVVMIAAALASALLRWKLPAAIARFFKMGNSQIKLDDLFTSGLVFVTLAGTLLLLGLAPFRGPLAAALLEPEGAGNLLLLGLLVGLLQAIRSLPEMVLRLERRIVSFHALGAVSTAIYIVLAPALILYADAGVRGVLIAAIGAETAALVTALILTRGFLTFALSMTELKRALRFSFPMLPSPLLRWAIDQTDRIVLLSLVGVGGVAIFGAAWRVTRLVSFPMTLFRGAWQPYSMLLLDEEARDEVLRRMLRYFAAGFSSLGLAVCAFGPELFGLLLPSSYEKGLLALPWLIGTAILRESRSFTHVGVFAAHRTGLVTRSLWVSGIVNLVVTLSLVSRFGLAGAAIGSFVASALGTALLGRFSERVSQLRFERQPLALAVFVYALLAAGMSLATSQMASPWSLATRVALLAMGLAFAWTTLLEPASRSSLLLRLRTLFNQAS